MTITRRHFLAAAGAAAALPGGATAMALANLGRIAGERGIIFGSAFDREVFEDRAYAQILGTVCRTGAIENSLKLDWLRPKAAAADYGVADRLIAFADVNHMAARGTALIWNDWTPAWLNSASSYEAEGVFERQIVETVGRYAGRMWAWDVVNEPFFPLHGRDGGFRKGIWLDMLGPGYVARAFRRAAAADPKAHLILNEAFCEQNDDWGTAIRPRLLSLVRQLKDDGVKIDGVGFQAHLKPHLAHDYRRFADYVRQMAALGVAIHITELDVDDVSLPDNVVTRDRMAAAQIAEFLTPVLATGHVKSVTCWHLSDKYSWYGNAPWYGTEVAKRGGDRRRKPRTHFLSDTMEPKPAWRALAAAFEGTPPI